VGIRVSCRQPSCGGKVDFQKFVFMQSAAARTVEGDCLRCGTRYAFSGMTSWLVRGGNSILGFGVALLLSATLYRSGFGALWIFVLYPAIVHIASRVEASICVART